MALKIYSLILCMCPVICLLNGLIKFQLLFLRWDISCLHSGYCLQFIWMTSLKFVCVLFMVCLFSRFCSSLLVYNIHKWAAACLIFHF